MQHICQQFAILFYDFTQSAHSIAYRKNISMMVPEIALIDIDQMKCSILLLYILLNRFVSILYIFQYKFLTMLTEVDAECVLGVD